MLGTGHREQSQRGRPAPRPSLPQAHRPQPVQRGPGSHAGPRRLLTAGRGGQRLLSRMGPPFGHLPVGLLSSLLSKNKSVSEDRGGRNACTQTDHRLSPFYIRSARCQRCEHRDVGDTGLALKEFRVVKEATCKHWVQLRGKTTFPPCVSPPFPVFPSQAPSGHSRLEPE